MKESVSRFNSTDIQKARELIQAGITDWDPKTTARVLCAVVGHPPVIESFFGQQTCARCDAILGEALLGAGVGKGKAILGHDCEDCRAVLEGLSPEQALLTRLSPEGEGSA